MTDREDYDDENVLLDISEGVIEERKQARETATPALQAKLDWIVGWQKNESSRGILGRWDLGSEIDEIWRDLKKNAGRVFGKTAKRTIALFMKEDPSVVNVAHRLFKTYERRKDLEEVTEMTMQDGVTPLSYSHIRQLLCVDSTQRRHELMNECLLKCWTSAQLGAAIQKENGGKTTNNPNGRGPTIPKDAETVIGQMLSFADDFDSRNVKVWRDNRYSVAAQVDKMEPIQYTGELAKKLGELAHRMRLLANEAVARAEEAETKFEQVTLVLKKGPAALKPIVQVAEKRPGRKKTG